ncbi:MAG: tetratricopeptide repeat protein [Planctomycetes bacterium]|nr:tetratricopeptide repeat protein [Planctomycetota bacterium]
MTDRQVEQARQLLRAGRPGQAQQVLAKVLQQRPGEPDALSLMGAIAYARGQYIAAAKWFRKAVAADRKRPMYHCQLAQADLVTGNLSEALAGYERAIKLKPDYADAVAGKADVLERRGKPGRAVSLLEPLIRSGQVGGGAAVIYVRSLRADGRGDDALAAGESLVGRADLPNPQRRSLLFIVGRLRRERKDVAGAFDAYRAANAIGAPDFEIETVRRRVDTIISTFSAPMLARLAGSGSDTEIPVFVFGMPRTGSTLTEQIIHAHPEAHGAGEIHDLSHLARMMPRMLGLETAFPACAGQLSAEMVTTLGASFLEQLGTYAPDARRIVDKSLENYELLGLVQVLYPRAHLICARRHPMDVCLSCYFQDLPPGLHPYSTDLSHLGQYYREYARLMDHWRQVLDMPILDVVYEDLVADPDPQSRRIIDFIGLDFDDACLRSHEAKRDVRTISYDQVREPMYTSAVARWERYAEYLGPLREALGDLVEGGD